MAWKDVTGLFSKYGAPITTVIVVFGALFAGVRYIVNSEMGDIRTDVTTLKGAAKSLDDKLGTTNQRIDGLLKEALERAFPKPSEVKSDVRGSLTKASDLLRLAKSEKIKLEPSLVADYGRELSALPGDSRTWKVLNQTLTYYSSMVDVTPRFPIQYVTNKDAECINADRATGWIMMEQEFEHCTQHLDRILGPAAVARKVFFKDLVFRDVHLIYSGGPLVLDNIYFVNCTFELEPSPASKKLAWTFLTENRVAHLQWPPS
jgi:hypothetical protein